MLCFVNSLITTYSQSCRRFHQTLPNLGLILGRVPPLHCNVQTLRLGAVSHNVLYYQQLSITEYLPLVSSAFKCLLIKVLLCFIQVGYMSVSVSDRYRGKIVLPIKRNTL